MTILMIPLWLSLILSVYTFDVPRITEDEITLLGLDCDKETYSCEGNQSPRTCKCDPQCAIYGDCCFDSPHRKHMNKTRHSIECMYSYFFLANKCPQDWGDQKTREHCESDAPTPTNLTELISNAKVVSDRSGISYKNVYCAKCNEDTENLRLWSIMTFCNSTALDNLTLDNLQYNRHISKWGLWQDSVNNQSFISCNVVSIPIYGEEDLEPRRCISAVEKCAPGWTNVSVKEKCESYQGVVHTSSRQYTYRNVHCAVCNGANLKEAVCDEGGGMGAGFGDTNFAKIFTFRPSGYKGSQCRKGMVYDPFMKRCHNLICLPFQKMRNGKCI